jgi:betaine-aldehyde dehydrogenase
MSLSMPPRQLYYDGQARAATSGKTFQIINPATATPLADIQVALHSDIDAAITAADRAFPSWSQPPLIARARILHKAAALLRERNDEIARVETLDSAKPYRPVPLTS